jgi:hypothetical protein
MPGPDEDPRPVPEIEGIEITTASPRYLLAMKLMATRIGEDDEDIEVLLGQCGVTDTQQALDLFEQMYPARELPVKARLFLEAVFEREAG